MKFSRPQRLRWIGLLGFLVLFPFMRFLVGCGPSRNSGKARDTPVAEPAIPVTFEDITARAGIHFKHYNGARGEKFLPEIIGSGVAFIDYDNDGWPDILFVNCKSWSGDSGTHATPQLYHNNRNGTFTDVTQGSGLDIEIYGMGIAVGDFDNDGYEDIYLTCLGPNHLFRNTLGDPNRTGKRLFEDVTRAAGVAGIPIPDARFGINWKWSTSAAWLDYDRDGKLDLFVCNYVEWSPKTDLPCGTKERKVYCPPNQFQGVPCTLYHNEGNGHFRDVSGATGISSAINTGKSLGVAVVDFNGDGWPDVAVANDTTPNFLFMNEAGKRFVERGAESGIALGLAGRAKAGMGIDAADWQNNGRIGLIVGNFSAESLSLFENDGQAAFNEVAHKAGVGETSLPFLTFGIFWFDYDLDGWPDTIAANGHISDIEGSSDSMVHYRERPLLYRNLGNGSFAETALQSGLSRAMLGRGIACADIDNDGDLDFAIVSNGESGLLFRNNGGNKNNWIRFKLQGKKSNRDGIGAIVRVTIGNRTQTQLVHSGGSYLSESLHELTFGLSSKSRVDLVEVLWPSGSIDRAGPFEANRRYLVTEGENVQPGPPMMP